MTAPTSTHHTTHHHTTHDHTNRPTNHPSAGLRRHGARVLFGAVLILIGLLVAACGSSQEAPSNDTSSNDASSTGTSLNDTDAATDEPTASDSPIENLLGVPVFDEVALDAWFNNLSREVEAKVAVCMRAQGFEYTPAGGPPVATANDAVGSDSLEYAQTRGLGIVAQFNEAAFDPDRDGSDANADLVASLSESERDAYYTSLQGTADPEDGTPREPDASAGCVGEATTEVFSVLEVFDAIGPTFDSYYDLYISDSRIIDTTNKRQRCMSEAGYTFGDEDEMFDHFASELNAITSSEDSFNDFDHEALGVTANADGGFSFHPGLVPDAQAAVDDLGEREIETAVAHWNCMEPHRETQLKVQREYEEKFVAEVGPQVAEIRGAS